VAKTPRNKDRVFMEKGGKIRKNWKDKPKSREDRLWGQERFSLSTRTKERPLFRARGEYTSTQAWGSTRGEPKGREGNRAWAERQEVRGMGFSRAARGKKKASFAPIGRCQCRGTEGKARGTRKSEEVETEDGGKQLDLKI